MACALKIFAISPKSTQTFKNQKEILKMNTLGEGHWIAFEKPENNPPFVSAGGYYYNQELKPNKWDSFSDSFQIVIVHVMNT